MDVTMSRLLHIGIVASVMGRTILGSLTHAAGEEPVTLEEVRVKAVRKEKVEFASDFLPDTQGAKIYAGKKTTSASLVRLPKIQNNNYRQAFSQMPGLLVSEQNNQGHVNLNYRAIGDPHESQDLLTLKDGIPIGVDRFGYSTTYYNPPLEAVERIELIRGGSALLYGPQPGPVLNYVTTMPPQNKKLSPFTQHLFGSNGFYSTIERAAGTIDRAGYWGYFNHSHSNGPRANEGFDLFGGSLKLVFDAARDARWIWNLDVHEKQSGEPGRLTLAQYRADRRQTLRPADELRTRRYASSLSYERDLSEETFWTTTLYGGTFDRFSRRRTSNTSSQNNLDRREVSSGGLESRVRHDYQAFGEGHTLTAGGTFYAADAPRYQDRSTSYPSEVGNPIFDFDYRTLYGALFGENQFNLGNLAVIPSFRLELLNIRVQENFNTGKSSALHNINEFYATPLFGVGLKYALGKLHELYFNASQGYKPPQFDDLAPTGNNTLPATDLDEGKTWTYELGLRGRPARWLQYDASAFLTDYENFFGTVTVGGNTQRKNVGRARYHGIDLSGEADLIGLADAAHNTPGKRLGDRFGSLSLYGNVSLLSAQFVEGPLRKSEPAYAPAYLAKAGAIYRLPGRAKVAVLGTFVEDHFWADNNAAGGTGLTAIPAYGVWDLTGELYLYKDTVKAFFGINNLTDEVYFSRVRSDGIEPALERNYYGGFSIEF